MVVAIFLLMLLISIIIAAIIIRRSRRSQLLIVNGVNNIRDNGTTFGNEYEKELPELDEKHNSDPRNV